MPRFVMTDIKTGHISGVSDANSPLEAVVSLAPSGDYEVVGGNTPVDPATDDGYRVYTASPDFVVSNTEDPHVREQISTLELVAIVRRRPPPAPAAVEKPPPVAKQEEAPS